MPAKAGIQVSVLIKTFWIPAYAGMTMYSLRSTFKNTAIAANIAQLYNFFSILTKNNVFLPLQQENITI